MALLVGSVVYALGVQARRLADRNAIVYTDGRTIQIPKGEAPVRSILWTDPAPLAGFLNTGDEEYHPALSPDGASVYFARGQLGGGADLYVSRRTPEGWSEPEALATVNTESSDEITPWVSPDGRSLVFATDRPEGRGGYDLWISAFEENVWSDPSPLQGDINSPHNDYAPSLSPDGLWLWFASNRPRPVEGDDTPDDPLVPPPSAGDYDLYRSGYAGASSTPPTRVEELCSPGDDVAPAWSPAGDFVYFASNREGGQGGFDIYRARIAGGSAEAPMAVGAPINSPVDELDPALGMGGFELLLSKPGPVTGEGDRADFDILRSESREVFPVVDRSRSALDWANLWRLFGPWLLWLLLLLALLLLLLKFKSSEGAVRRWRKLGLFARCLLLSVLIHALLLALLGMLRVSTAISDLLDDGASRVRLTTSGGSVASQLRSGFEVVSTTPMPTTSPRAEASSIPTETTLAESNAGDAPLEARPVETQVRESSEPVEVASSEQPAPAASEVREIQSPSAGQGDASSETVAQNSTQPQSSQSTRAATRSTTSAAQGAALAPESAPVDAAAADQSSLTAATPNERVISQSQPTAPAEVAANTPEVAPGDRAGGGESSVAVERQATSSARVQVNASGAATRSLEIDGQSTPLEPAVTNAAAVADASSDQSRAPISEQAPASVEPSVRVAHESNHAAPESEAAPANAADRIVSGEVIAPDVEATGGSSAVPSSIAAGASSLTPSPLDAQAASEANVTALPTTTTVATNEYRGDLATPAAESASIQVSPEAGMAQANAVQTRSARAQGGAPVESPASMTAQLSAQRSQATPESAPLGDPSPTEPREQVTSTGVLAPRTEPGVSGIGAPSDQLAEGTAEPEGAAEVARADTSSRAGVVASDASEPSTTMISPNASEMPSDQLALAKLTPSNTESTQPLSSSAPSVATPDVAMSLPSEMLEADAGVETRATDANPINSAATPRAAVGDASSPNPETTTLAFDPVRVEVEHSANAGRPSDAAPAEFVAAPVPSGLAPLAAVDLAPMESQDTPSEIAQDPIAQTTAIEPPEQADPRAPLAEHDNGSILALADIAPIEKHLNERTNTAIPDAATFDPAPTLSAPALPIPQLAAAPMPTIEPEVEQVYPQRAPEVRQQLVERGGGSEETEKAVADALAWLARNQSRDGRWSSRGFEEFGGRSGDPARYDFDVASTGLALLCFFGADHTPDKPGPYQQTVAQGLAWLLQREGDPGDFRQGESMYSQGIATIALCEGYAMTRDEDLLPPIERAIAFITGARNSSVGGWRYEPGQAGDTSVLGWMVMAMKSAQRCGIDVDPRAMAAASDWLDLVMDDRWDGRYAYRPGMDATHSMTAEGMFVQQLLGLERQDERMSGSARFVLQDLPRWDAESPTYAWYYATLALFQHGGGAWTRWNRAISRELVRAQRDDGPAAGSWDPTDRYARIGGRIYQTAICTLSLEVYYRYLPMYVDAPEVVGGE